MDLLVCLIEITYLSIHPFSFAFRSVNNATVEIDRDHELRPSLFPWVTVTQPIIRFLAL